MGQFFTRYFIPPFGSRIGWGVIAAAIPTIIGLVSLLVGKAPMASGSAGRVQGEGFVLYVEGRAATYAALFWILLGVWLHVLNYWSEHRRLKIVAPILSNAALIAALVLGVIALLD